MSETSLTRLTDDQYRAWWDDLTIGRQYRSRVSWSQNRCRLLDTGSDDEGEVRELAEHDIYLVVDREQIAQELDSRIQVGQGSLRAALDSVQSTGSEAARREFDAWSGYNETLIAMRFLGGNDIQMEYRAAYSRTWPMGPLGELARDIENRWRAKIACLEALRERLPLYPTDRLVPASTSGPQVEQALQLIAGKFHAVALRLATRHNKRPAFEIADEYDVQDLLGALLVLFFDDVRAEEWAPSVGGKASRVDFLLRLEKTVVETKITRPGHTGKEIGDELIIDRARYAAGLDWEHLVCIVYDPASIIQNRAGFEHDLSHVDHLRTTVWAIPR